MAVFVGPLKVHLCWFEGATRNTRCEKLARRLYELLHRPIHDDVVRKPGLEIPTEFGRDLKHLLGELDANRELATDLRVIVVLLDDVAYAHADSRALLERARRRARPGGGDLVLPIVVDRWKNLEGPDVLRVEAGADPWRLDADVAAIIGGALVASRRRLAGTSAPDPLKAQLFISYTGEGTPADQIRTCAEGDPWFDTIDATRTRELARRVAGADGLGVFLVVRTDPYFDEVVSTSAFSAAVRAGMSFVTLLATKAGEHWTSAQSGNHRTIAWQEGREWECIARCIQTWLRDHHFRAYAAAAIARSRLPGDAWIVTGRPAIHDVVAAAGRGGTRLVVHPDPPLTVEASNELLAAFPAVRLATPTTLFGRVLLARDPRPPLTGTTVAFSLSEVEDLPSLANCECKPRSTTGLTQEHVDDALYSIVLATLSSGARIAYGGDFRSGPGYTKKLSDLHRSWGKLGSELRAQLVCYLDPEQGAAGREGDASGDIDYDPRTVLLPGGAEQFPGLRFHFWHLAMRRLMAEQCDARIVLGGKARPRSETEPEGYLGPWPGLLEEAWRTLAYDRALYVVGGFGGGSGLIADLLLDDELPRALTAASQRGQPVGELAREFGTARAALATLFPAMSGSLLCGDGNAWGIEELARAIRARWDAFVAGDKKAWDNGLTVEENRRLLRSTDRSEITHLVFAGLRRRAAAATPPDEISWSVYQGDIASLPGIDGYAVTSTPGVPVAGALAALDKRMDGRLATTRARSDAAIAAVQADGGQLAGRQVLVARLELPPAGSQLAPAAIEQLAEAIARHADEIGLRSIACVPFATTMGVSVEVSVRAIVAGVARGARSKLTVVLCEDDRARYRQLKLALPAATELRAGPAAVTTASSIVLHVEASPPSSMQPYGSIAATLFAPHETKPVVPYGKVNLLWSVWFAIRDHNNDFDKLARMGQVLWRAFLTDQMRARITEEAGGRIVILSDRNASGMPWEILVNDDGVPLALSFDIVRRVALEGPSLRPDRSSVRGARIRVLLVVHQNGLRNAPAEAKVVQETLQLRADVEIDSLVDDQATIPAVRDALAQGSYDVLHYVGHAAFDEAQPSKSGLRLYDGVFNGDHVPASAPPRFVYLSACESGRLRQKSGQPAVPISNGLPLAEAFLRNGVSALLGTFLAVEDAAAMKFATEVYSMLTSAHSLGAAVRSARSLLFKAACPDWGNFLLFGDDDLTL